MHTIITRLLTTTALLLVSGCAAASSGVDGSKQLSATTAEERGLVCDYWRSLYMDEFRIAMSCPTGVPVQIGGPRELCEAAVASAEPTCDLTVGTFETCITAAEADPCAMHDASICPEAVLDCLGED